MTSFHERQKSLFNQLKDAEEQHGFSKSNKTNTEQDYGVIDRHTYRKVKHEMRQFRGKESIFKKPDANIRQCLKPKSIPGYVKNPQKWVYYSLEDVTPDLMSDKTNTATALALIRKMEQKDDSTTNMITDSNDDDEIFKKPSFNISCAVNKTQRNEDENIVVKSNKVIMPEYIVGVSKKKDKKPKLGRRSSEGNTTDMTKKSELKLDHLYGDEDEE